MSIGDRSHLERYSHRASAGSSIEAMAQAGNRPAPSFFAVIVLYKVSPWDSPSLRSLLASANRVDRERLKLRILLYDNTPDGQQIESLPANVEYRASPQNGGLAEAYNHALLRASSEGFQWLLTLDQDTDLPEDFLGSLASIANGLEVGPVAAIVPRVQGEGKPLSPHRFAGGILHRWLPAGYEGISPTPIYAFNSGSVLRIDALEQVGGYDPRFWLDFSDYMTFHKLQQYGKRVYVAGSIKLDHEFSMQQMGQCVSPGRYSNALEAESAFWDLEMGRLAGLGYTLRLVARICKRILKRDPPELRAICSEVFRKRIVYSRTQRLSEWRRSVEARRCATLPKLLQSKISVCMATYNGEKYIFEQLQSILKQLSPEDEVIIVDDASTDRTCEVIRRLMDPRILLITHATNKGVVQTFEDSIRSASGGILFLSDQDDLWAADKVSRVLRAFEERPDVDIVCSAIQAINEEGTPCYDEIYSEPRPFTAGVFQNLLSNRFQGSAMAFRAGLIRRILPFPSRYYVLHDVWIGVRNSLTGGKTLFIPEPLLFYRRHSLNASRRLDRYRQIKKRLHLLWALCKRSLQDAL